MVHDFCKCNKTSGIYWLKQPLENTSFRVKIRPKANIIILPKFCDYYEKQDQDSLHLLENNKQEEYTFKWQEKKFCLWQYQKYSDEYNFATDTEIKYHETIKNGHQEPKKVYSYIHEDSYLPLPLHKRINNESFILNKINNYLNQLSLEDTIGSSDISSSTRHLFKSEEHIWSNDEQWVSMHIAFDNSEYNEDSQLLFKQESILLSLYHNISHNYLIISPDVNDITLDPYSVDLEGDIGLEYGVEIEFEEETGDELCDFLNKLLQKWETKHKKLVSFVMPPLGKKKYFLNLEIVSAEDFELDNIYIEFHIKIPDDIQHTALDLQGKTHTSKALRTGHKCEWLYGHMLEFELECATGIDPPPLKIFFEAISLDWCGRHRTEGYSCLTLPLDPGDHRYRLSCSRPEELDTVEAESRRFFVGGCNLIKDLDVLTCPQLQDANFRYVSTGTISVRSNIISQAHFPGSLPPEPHYSASALIRGAEDVLRKYKRAKATLAAATRSVTTKLDGSGDG